MSSKRREVGGTKDIISKSTGAIRQVVVDTDDHSLVLMDGTTTGGHRFAKANGLFESETQKLTVSNNGNADGSDIEFNFAVEKMIDEDEKVLRPTERNKLTTAGLELYYDDETDELSLRIGNTPIATIAMNKTNWDSTSKPVIDIPVIISPADGYAITGQNLAVAIDNPQSQYEHTATDWKISSDEAGDVIVASAMNSTDLTTHIFPTTGLVAGKTYWLFARYRTTNGVAGKWSNGSSILYQGE